MTWRYAGRLRYWIEQLVVAFLFGAIAFLILFFIFAFAKRPWWIKLNWPQRCRDLGVVAGLFSLLPLLFMLFPTTWRLTGDKLIHDGGRHNYQTWDLSKVCDVSIEYRDDLTVIDWKIMDGPRPERITTLVPMRRTADVLNALTDGRLRIHIHPSHQPSS